MIQEWADQHEYKLQIAALIVAALVLLVAIYRWLLLKWRNDATLRKYAYLHSLSSANLPAHEVLRIDIPEPQHVQLRLKGANQFDRLLLDEQLPVGLCEYPLELSQLPHGEYELVMISQDQESMKRFRWSGLA